MNKSEKKLEEPAAAKANPKVNPPKAKVMPFDDGSKKAKKKAA